MDKDTPEKPAEPRTGGHPGRDNNHDFEEHEQVYELPSGYLSVSQVGLYQKCGERYRRRYVLGQFTPNSSNLGHGRLIHKTVETLLQYKIDHEQHVPPADLAGDTISAHLQEMSQDVEIWDPKVPNIEEFESTARDLIDLYVDARLPEVLPRAVELKLETVLRGRIPFIGYTDLIEMSLMDADFTPMKSMSDLKASDSVRDLKATGKKYGANRVDNALQLSMYAVITGLEHVGFDLLVQKKRSEFAKQDSFRSSSEKEHAVDVVEDVARAISAGVFTRADPESWMCTPKWCPYFNECRGAQRSIHTTPPLADD
jgi:hypothetical protein